MEFETLKLDRPADNIAWITVNRPDALNALNRTVLEELRDVAKHLATDDGLDVVVLTGEGRAFVAGADIKAMVDYSSEEAQAFSVLGHEAFQAISDLPCVVVGAINGFALGGGLELALSCDLLYASDKAKLGLPEVSLSVIPGWGGTQRLGRMIGWHQARELVLTGKQIRADEAKRIGLVLDVFPIDEFQSKIEEVVNTIASHGPLATRAAKRALLDGQDLPLAKGIEAEQRAFGGLFGTNDQREGMSAFIDRREANWTRS